MEEASRIALAPRSSARLIERAHRARDHPRRAEATTTGGLPPAVDRASAVMTRMGFLLQPRTSREAGGAPRPPPSAAAPGPERAAGRRRSRSGPDGQRRPPNSQSRIWSSKSLIESGSSVPQKDVDGLSRRRLERQRDSGRSRVVGREQLTVDDQALAQQRREVAQQQGGCVLSRSRHAVRDHEEARVGRPSRGLPHRPAQQVLEAADDVVLEQARTVVRLALDELASRFRARQVDDVNAAGPPLSIGRERGAAGNHAVGESVHVRPVLLVERGIMLDARGAGRGTAVDEEVHAAECRVGGVSCPGSGSPSGMFADTPARESRLAHPPPGSESPGRHDMTLEAPARGQCNRPRRPTPAPPSRPTRPL